MIPEVSKLLKPSMTNMSQLIQSRQNFFEFKSFDLMMESFVPEEISISALFPSKRDIFHEAVS